LLQLVTDRNQLTGQKIYIELALFYHFEILNAEIMQVNEQKIT